MIDGYGEVPYDEIDDAVYRLVAAINEYPAVQTLGSCGGHPHPRGDQAPEGEWWVLVQFERSEAGWVTLEFFAWAFERELSRTKAVSFRPDSSAPFINFPGRMLRFELAGHGDVSSDEVADWLMRCELEFFVPPDEAEQYRREMGYSEDLP